MNLQIESAKTREICGIHVIKSHKTNSRKLKDNATAPTLHGHQIWRSSYMLLDYFERNPLKQNLRVMDIGCGWGVSGIYCAKQFASQAVLVDADKRVFSFVEYHEKRNNVSVKTLHRTFKDLGNQDFLGMDMIVGSDICFWPELVKDLKQVIVRALKANIQHIVIADPGRPTFMELANYCQLHYKSELCVWEFGGKTKRKGYILSIAAS